MTAPSWVTPNTRLFLVAYEGDDGRPSAVAVSDHGVAARLARRFGGEVIDTVVDNHADMRPTAASSTTRATSANASATTTALAPAPPPRPRQVDRPSPVA